MRLLTVSVISLHAAASVLAQTASSTVPSTAVAQITGCHFHGEEYHCVDNNGNEGLVQPPPTVTSSAPASYTGCHTHGDETYCLNGDDEVQYMLEDHDHEGEEDHDHATTQAPATTTSSSPAETSPITAVTGCHFHGSAYMCLDPQGGEGSIVPAPTNTEAAPAEYTGCHYHGSNIFCVGGGDEVQFQTEETSESSSEAASSEEGVSCHFHAGVEHCVDAEGNTVEQTCEFVERERNKGLRVGLLFAIFVGTGAAVSLPVLLQNFANLNVEGMVLTICKQFGTGVILSTSLVHLFTHAQLMFANECMGPLAYESTCTAIAMAGVFLAFCFEYGFSRLLARRQQAMSAVVCEVESKQDITSNEAAPNGRAVGGHDHNTPLINPRDQVSVWLIEAGIIFHSMLIGLTLVVAGDSGIIVLFIVILFHQAFEGIALGARISALTTTRFSQKLFMCACYAVTTPIGMAIGMGVLSQFNGNDKSTLIALGTIDSFSAGILLWTGLVDMLAMDWLLGPLATAGLWKTLAAFASLISGMVLMSVLGKWT